jgi:hypothetical protein
VGIDIAQVHRRERIARRYAGFQQASSLVMPGLVPGIRVLAAQLTKDVDGRAKPGHDDGDAAISALKVPEHLRPDGDHADEQRERGERGGVLQHGFEHGSLP